MSGSNGSGEPHRIVEGWALPLTARKWHYFAGIAGVGGTRYRAACFKLSGITCPVEEPLLDFEEVIARTAATVRRGLKQSHELVAAGKLCGECFARVQRANAADMGRR